MNDKILKEILIQLREINYHLTTLKAYTIANINSLSSHDKRQLLNAEQINKEILDNLLVADGDQLKTLLEELDAKRNNKIPQPQDLYRVPSDEKQYHNEKEQHGNNSNN